MAENTGFFDNLGLNPQVVVDPRNISPNRQTAGAGGRAVGSALAGLLGATTNKFGGGGTFNLGQQFEFQKDDRDAKAMGLGGGGEELRSIRRIKAATAGQNFGDMRSPEARLRMAEFTANMARKEGNASVLAKSLTQIQNLRKEQQEWDKNQAVLDRAAEDAEDRSIVDAYDEGKPTAGIEDVVNGVPGQHVSDGKGGTVFKPYSKTFNRVNPDDLEGGETLDVALRRTMRKSERAALNNSIVSNTATIKKTDRIISDLIRFGDRAQEIMTTPGEFATGIDGFIRGVRGIVGQFVPSAGVAKDSTAGMRENGYWSGKASWAAKANDASDVIWSFFPEEIRENSEAAAQHRARIMDLAYMAARLAEPSNRGLSDNDIHNALIRIAGSSSNPQALSRRLVEMIADSTFEVEQKLDSWSMGFPRFSEDEVEFAIGGKALMTMREERQRLLDKHGITINPDTLSASFADPMDSTLQEEPQASDTNFLNLDARFAKVTDEDIKGMTLEELDLYDEYLKQRDSQSGGEEMLGDVDL